MNDYPPIAGIVLRMIGYGVMLGIIAGLLSVFTITLPSHLQMNVDMPLHDIGEAFFALIIIGVAFGGFYGSLAGLTNGVALGFVSLLAFRKIHKPRLYKAIIGSLTAIITGIVLMSTVLPMTVALDYMANTGAWMTSIAMSVIIFVYVSQIVARNYIYATNGRKSKA